MGTINRRVVASEDSLRRRSTHTAAPQSGADVARARRTHEKVFCERRPQKRECVVPNGRTIHNTGRGIAHQDHPRDEADIRHRLRGDDAVHKGQYFDVGKRGSTLLTCCKTFCSVSVMKCVPWILFLNALSFKKSNDWTPTRQLGDLGH